MENFENPKHRGNSAKFRTGKPCIEAGCTDPAGTAWSPFWCFKHNVERMRRIDSSLNKIASDLGISNAKLSGGPTPKDTGETT